MCDLDGVVFDFDEGMAELAPDLYLGEGDDYEKRSKMVDEICQNNPTIFHNLKPLPGAIEAVKELMFYYDVYFLSTPMEAVPESFTGKKICLNKYFGNLCSKKLILTHRKDLVIGDYLIDDRTRNGAGEFTGELIQFATEKYPNWDSVLKYLIDKI